MRKFQKMLIWIGIISYMIFVMGFVSARYNDRICERINVKVIDSLTNRFVSAEEITDILLENGSGILGYPLKGINTLELGKTLNEESFIKHADIYKTVDGALNVDIIQRKPILRIINRQGKSYYLDKEGVILPVSGKFTSRVLVANGFISEPFVHENNKSVLDMEVPDNKRDAVIFDLFKLAAFISGSELWNAQIAQIYVNNKYELELIPRVGAHIIYLGSAGDYETKFRKLEALYLYGLSNTGWNNYDIINLKYDNQIVCTKR
ncbi:MAG: cell division protein FtsQ/DivIB [Bacteroidales bacterium]|jgi:cell division protein FtsQ